jgi:hypothetical protein
MYDVDDVLPHYIGTALWSSLHYPESEGDGESEPVPMDQDHGPDDVAPETLATLREQVAAFLTLIDGERPTVWAEMADTIWQDPEQVGHDLWLTRNHHGTGFWDRYYGDHPGTELGDWLTACTHKLGHEIDLYAGSDGKIYV